MKKSFRFLFMLCTFIFVLSFQSFAGTWEQFDSYWRYLKDDNTYAQNEYINHNNKWYYIDINGIMLTNAVTPDGYYFVNENGERNDDSGIDEEKMKKDSLNSEIIIFNKKTHYLQLWINGEKRYQCIGTSGNNPNDKNIEGDYSTPEGEFYICNKNPNSSCYKAFVLSYPNIEDAERGLQQGIINSSQYNKIVNAINKGKSPDFYTQLGGYIEIHGNRNISDLSRGCITVSNQDMDNMWNLVSVGTKIIVTK